MGQSRAHESQTHPAEDEMANQCLKLWGIRDRMYGPEGFKSHSAFVAVARGLDIEWNDETVEVVGYVVSCLHAEDKDVVWAYYRPDADGQWLSVRAVCKKIGKHHSCVNRILDRCIGRVAMALEIYFKWGFDKKMLQVRAK